jgi:ectoine hydroxylase-related dioxygenase (phytanoyl-CoA dioxygenase family)
MIASIVLNERLGEFVSKIMGWQSVRIAQDDIVVKPPAYQNNLDEDTMEKRIDTVGFHQDSAYISIQFLPYESNSVTVWMAIDDTDEENGCLEYAVGSHLWRPILHSHPTNEEEAESSKEKHDNSIISSFHDSDETSYRSGLLGAHFAHKRECEMKENSVPLLEIQSATPVKAGHAIIHHQDVWHGSGPNKSDTRYRRALVGHYIRGDSLFVNDDSNASTHPFGKSSYIYGRYKKYQSTELEETFFPIIYASKQDDTTIENNRTEWIDDYVLKFP